MRSSANIFLVGLVFFAVEFAFGFKEMPPLSSCRVEVSKFDLMPTSSEIIGAVEALEYRPVWIMLIECGKSRYYIRSYDSRMYVLDEEVGKDRVDLYLAHPDLDSGKLGDYDPVVDLQIGQLVRIVNADGTTPFNYDYELKLHQDVSFEKFKIISERKFTDCDEEYGLKEMLYWVERTFYFEVAIKGKNPVALTGTQLDNYFSIPFVCF